MIFKKKNNNTTNNVASESEELWLKKYKSFRTKVTFSSFILLSLIIAFVVFFSGRYSIENVSQNKINKLQRDIRDIERKQDDLERKTFSSQKFIDISRNLSEKKKKTKGMSVGEAQALFESLDDRHNIRGLQIQLSTPVELKGDFARDTIKTMNSEVILNFNALLDTDVEDFLKEVYDNLTGYIVITKYSLRRTREIDDLYIKEIYRGEWPVSLSGQIVFRWYVLS